MKKLTHHDTLHLQKVVTIGGDLLLLPRVRLPNFSESFALQKGGVINVGSSLIARNALIISSLELQRRYDKEMYVLKKEPAWIEEHPIRVRMMLRYNHVVMESDPLAIMNHFPFTGIWYMVTDGGLCEEIERLFKLRRLQGVKQLGFLQQPWVAMSEQTIVLPLSENTRYAHSLDVMTLSSVIGYNLRLPRGDFNTLRVAGFTHDCGTPAGGDSVKLIDLDAFDEDQNYERLLRLLDQDEWEDLKRKHSISEEKLCRTILNEGLFGQILDVADKLAYVARDIERCLEVMHNPDDDEGYVGTTALKEIVADFPYLCSIWDSLKVINGQLVFTDVWRLIAFLKARIVLFRELYFHPRARFGEYLISRILVKKLYETGALTRDMLLQMGDNELEGFIGKSYKNTQILRALSQKTRMESFKTLDEAHAFQEKLVKSGIRFSLIENHRNSVKTGTHFLVTTPQGPKSLEEAYPGDARELYEMANMLPAVHVYYFADNTNEVGDELAKLLATTQT